ncbi:MAG TPA: non-ribosomal peptide synthetase, partial [Ktedonobacteraceae bacterium]
RGICNRLLWIQKEFPLDEQDRVLQKTPYSFDVSIWEFFWPLITGGRLVVARPEGHKDPAYIADVIKREGISIVHFVPSMFQAFLNEPDIEQCVSLRRIICSGEALSYELQERCFARLKAQLHNLYGPTETAVEVTAWHCERGSQLRTVPIGYPIANTQMHILDEHLQPVPLGTAGELHIGGVQVGRGYWHRPELTAEKFIRDPFSSDPEARLYKTGDLARYLSNGAIEYLGRIDHQVKINGIRIEVREIESALLTHSQVREAAVVPRQNDVGGQRLIAYLVSATDHSVLLSEIRHYLRQILPAYMVPAHFVFLPSLPLTLSGKLDRLALPAPEETDIRDETPLVLPQTPIEAQLADIWQAVLGVKQIGIHDSFFDLGGNSLLATQIVLHVRETLHVDIALHDVFRVPTVAELAVFVAEQQAQAAPRLSMQEIDEETAQNVLAHFSSLSDEEVDALYQLVLKGNTHVSDK